MKRPDDLDQFLDSHPLPTGPMPPRETMISLMVDRLREDEVDETEILLFEACSQELTDERLFKSTAIFWNTRI